MLSLKRLAVLSALSLAAGAMVQAARAADTPEGPGSEARPTTEIDVSGPYHAFLNNENYPAHLEVWGNDAALKISIDGQEKPMIGMFVNNQLQVMFKYGAANFNLTTAVKAKYDGCNFDGQYARVDDKLGPKNSPITLTPDWCGGGGGTPVKMPVPPRPSDMAGAYGMQLTKNGKSVNDRAVFEVADGEVKITTGGRVYHGDFSPTQFNPMYWEGRRMDTFHLQPTETGFKGKLTKEVNGKPDEYEATFTKGIGGGGGDDHHWTYVYDVIFNNSPPSWIGKLTLHNDEATLVILVKGEKATMKGSLVDGVLSGTGNYGKSAVSIRAQQNPNGFAGVFRRGSDVSAQEGPVILKNRPVRVAGPKW